MRMAGNNRPGEGSSCGTPTPRTQTKRTSWTLQLDSRFRSGTRPIHSRPALPVRLSPGHAAGDPGNGVFSDPDALANLFNIDMATAPHLCPLDLGIGTWGFPAGISNWAIATLRLP